MTCADGPPGILGLQESVFLPPRLGALAVGYRLPEGAQGVDVEALLSPDYRRLMRHGPGALAEFSHGRRRELRNGDVGVWLELPPGDDVSWVPPSRPDAGHGRLVQFHASTDRFVVLLGSAPLSGRTAAQLFAAAGEGSVPGVQGRAAATVAPNDGAAAG